MKISGHTWHSRLHHNKDNPHWDRRQNDSEHLTAGKSDIFLGTFKGVSLIIIRFKKTTTTTVEPSGLQWEYFKPLLSCGKVQFYGSPRLASTCLELNSVFRQQTLALGGWIFLWISISLRNWASELCWMGMVSRTSTEETAPASFWKDKI